MNDNDAMIVEKLGKAYITVHSHPGDANFAWAFRLATVLSFRPFSRSGLRNHFARAVSRMPKETIQTLFGQVMHNYSNLTDGAADLLMKLCIVNLAPLDDGQREKIWNFLIEKMQGGEHMGAAMHCCTALVKRSTAGQRVPVHLFQFIPKALSSPNGTEVERCLSMCVHLHKRELMPLIVLNQLVIHFLSFSKYLENPLSKYTCKLIRGLKEDSFNDELISALNVFVMSRLKLPEELLKRELNRILVLVQQNPHVAKVITSPFVSSCLRIIESNRDMVDNQMFVSRLLMMTAHAGLSTEKRERDRLASVCFEILRGLLRDPRKDKGPLLELFCTWILQVGYDRFPKEFLDQYRSIPENDYPGMAACALETLPPEMIMTDQLKPFWDATITLLFTSRKIRPITISVIVTHIARDLPVRQHLMNTLMGQLLNGGLENVTKNERKMQLLKTVLAVDDMSRLDTLERFWDAHTPKPQGEKCYPWQSDEIALFRNLVMTIEYMRPDQQSKYISDVLRRVWKTCPQWLDQLVIIADYLLKSADVTNETKVRLVRALSKRLTRCEPRCSESFLETVKNTPCVAQYHSLACIRFALSCKYTRRLRYMETVRTVLGHSERDRFLRMEEILSDDLWTDENLAPLALMISDQTRAWQPLASLSHELDELGSAMFQAILERILNDKDEDLMAAVRRLLVLSLHSGKHSRGHLQIALLAALDEKKIIPDGLLSMSIVQRTQAYEYINSDNIDDINDKVIQMADAQGPLLNRLLPDKKSAAAGAYLFLQHYTEANMIGFNDSSPFVQKLCQCSQRLDEADHGTFARLAQSSIAAELASLQHMKRPKQQKIERFITLKLAERAKTGQSLPGRCVLEMALSRRELDYLKLAEQRLDPSASADALKPQIIDHSDPRLMVFAPCVQDLFREVSGYTPKGFLVAMPDQMKRALEKVMSGSSDPYTMYKWSIITYTIFLSSPNDALARSIVKCYCSLIENRSFPVFMKMEMTARMITICRLALRSGDNTIQFNEKTLHFFKPWIVQVLQLASNNWFANATKPVLNGALTITTQFAIDRVQPAGQRNFRLARLLETLTAIEMMASDLFQCDLPSYQQKRQLEMYIRDVLRGNTKPRMPKDLPITESMTEQIRALADDNAIYDYINAHCPGTTNYLQLREMVAKVIENGNTDDELQLPSRLPEMGDNLRVVYIFDDVEQVANNAIQLRAFTSTGRSWFLLQQCEAAPTCATFSNILFMLNSMLKWCGTSRARCLGVTSSHVHLVGPSTILYEIPGPVTDQHSSLCQASSKHDYYTMQLRAARSLAVEGAIRDMFSLRQRPSELVCPSTSSFVTNIADFQITEPSSSPSIYITPEMLTRFAQPMQGEIMLSLAAFGSTIVQHIESLRAAVEIAVGDSLTSSLTHSNLLARTSEIEKKPLRFAPPVLPGCIPDDADEWISTLVSFFESATILTLEAQL